MSQSKAPNKFDDAAAEAAKEFKPSWSAQEVAEWMAKWTPKAGIRRLGRILMQAFGLKWT